MERVLLTNSVILVEWTLYLLLGVFDEGSNFFLVIVGV